MAKPASKNLKPANKAGGKALPPILMAITEKYFHPQNICSEKMEIIV